MGKVILIVSLFICVLACTTKTPNRFSEAALQEQFVALDGKSVSFESILEKHRGRTVLITIWATWCRDCNAELPRVKAVQQHKNDVDYVFLSLDRTIESWKRGISKFDIQGDHYFVLSGWKGPFVDFIDLDWITRYMVIDRKGQIKVYKAIKVNNTDLRESLTN